MYLRENLSSIVNYIIIRAIKIPWNLMSPNSSQDKKDFKENRIHLFKKRKKLNTMIVEKLDISSEITDSNNNNYSNVFKGLYR